LKGIFASAALHMIKILLTVAVLASASSLAGFAIAQDQQGEPLGNEISSQCAHRRIMGPDPQNDCIRKLRSDPQPGYGRGPLGYGRGPVGYGQNPLGYLQDQFGYGQGVASQQPDQGEEEQPNVRREPPKASASPKIATAPKPKKPSPPPRLAAQNQKEQQLYQEYLEWRNRRLFNEP
jgi:hypothetical protein